MKSQLHVVACVALLFAAACSSQSAEGPTGPSVLPQQGGSAPSPQLGALSSSGCFDEGNASLTFNGNAATASFVVTNDACVGRRIYLTSYYTTAPFTPVGGDIVEPYPQFKFAEVSVVLVAGLNTITVEAPGCPYVGAQVDLAFIPGINTLPDGGYYPDADFVLAAVRNNECVLPVAGCTLGYWKNHQDKWPGAYTPDTLVSSVFSGPGIPAGYTFLQALQYGGGVKAQILLRQAIAGVLNTAATQYQFALTFSQLQAMVNTALAGSNGDKTSLSDQIATYNEAQCPLN